MIPHPILEHHQVNDRCGDGLRAAARQRLVTEARQQEMPPPPLSSRPGLWSRLGVARAIWPRRNRTV